MQLPLGVIADRINRNYIFAGVGCLMVAAAYGLTSIPLMATIIVGLGNGAFHIGGGIDVLNISEEKSSALGVFVSPGAFGIYFGTLTGKGSGAVALPVVLALLVAGALILVVRRVWKSTYADNKMFSPQASPMAAITVLLLFLVVCLRSYAGLAINFPWKTLGYWGIALVCATAFGKAAGGFLLDRLGPVKAVVISLGLAVVLFLFPNVPAAGLAAVFLFNITMPITLWLVARVFPGAKGFSFGLLTFALFIGFLPVYLGVSGPLWLFAPVAAVSLVLLLAGLMMLKADKRLPGAAGCREDKREE